MLKMFQQQLNITMPNLVI